MGEFLPGFHTNLCSDVRRDGMYLELVDETTGDEVAEVFFSDATGKMDISVFRAEMPLEAVELLIEQAKRRLPPRERVEPAPRDN